MKKNKLKHLFRYIKENWYFIRQDIVSYAMSTILYIILCLIRQFTIQSFLYSLFDLVTFYLPFWFIRINFADTYHSDKWKHCKKWTRIMLCVGVFVLWILPIRYSLFNGLFVAFTCCLILYLVSIEVNEKKRIIKENEELHKHITELLEKQSDPKEKLLKLCEEYDISERDTKVAIMYYIDRMKPKQIWEWLCDNREDIEYGSVYKLLNRLNKKLKEKI